MSGYDEIRCEMPMHASDLGPDTVFHTRAFVAVFGERYTITADGRLVRDPWSSPIDHGQEESFTERDVRDEADQASKGEEVAFDGHIEFWTTEAIRRTFFACFVESRCVQIFKEAEYREFTEAVRRFALARLTEPGTPIAVNARVAASEDGLLISLPKAIVEALSLREGDEVEAKIVGERAIEIARVHAQAQDPDPEQ